MKDIKIFLKKKKKKKRNVRECYKNPSEDEKQKLVEYRKKHFTMRKKCHILIIRNYFNLENFAFL